MIVDLDKIYEMFKAESVIVLAALFFGVYSFIMVTSGSIGSAPGFSSSGANDRFGAIKLIVNNNPRECNSVCGDNQCLFGYDSSGAPVGCTTSADECVCGTHEAKN